MDKEILRLWEDYITMIEKSKKAGESPTRYLARTEGEGFFIQIPPGKEKPENVKKDFCRQALASRKEREPIRDFYKRMSAVGYGIEFKKPGFDRDKVMLFKNFVKEVVDHIGIDEPIESFITRMEQKGYTLTFSSASDDRNFFIRVIEYLNAQADTEYRIKFPSSNSRLILARKKEGYTWSDFKEVIDKKVRQWRNTEYEKYLRPETLFDSLKFSSYIGEKEAKQAPKRTGSTIDIFGGGVEAAKAAAKGLASERRGSGAGNSNNTD